MELSRPGPRREPTDCSAKVAAVLGGFGWGADQPG